MGYTTLIAPADLSRRLGDDEWAIVDCRFDLRQPEIGTARYRDGHIPGAVYAHLDRDLSGPIVPGQTGRHPLPPVARFAETLGAWGIDDTVQVVAYDDSGGAFAARLWWMLRWVGHARCAVLDGGWPRWVDEGYEVRGGSEGRARRRFQARVHPEAVVDADAVSRAVDNASWRVFDARAADRYRGENETIDPVAGHIPGATSLPFAGNLTPDGRFRPVEELRARFNAAMEDVPAAQSIVYCGSGVTAAHNVLAMAHAGLEGARLYPGSWSEWITDPKRPVAVG